MEEPARAPGDSRVRRVVIPPALFSRIRTLRLLRISRAKGESARNDGVRRLLRALAVFIAPSLAACARTPSPLSPALRGSIGTPSCGVLADGAELPREAEGLRWLRVNDRHWGL